MIKRTLGPYVKQNQENTMQIETTIHRARTLLAYMQWVDVVMRLVDEGIEPGQAYLSTKAAACLDGVQYSEKFE